MKLKTIITSLGFVLLSFYTTAEASKFSFITNLRPCNTWAADTIYCIVGKPIELANNGSPVLYCDGEIYATGRFAIGRGSWFTSTVYNPDEVVLAIFDQGHLLPKGKEYTFVIPQGSVRRVDDNTLLNDEWSQKFTVPNSLGTERPEQYPAGDTISSGARFGFSYHGDFDIEAAPGMKAQLLREGRLAREFDIDAEWMDFDYTKASALIPATIKYDKGVHYSVVFRAGSVRGPRRPDMGNKEVRFDFVGGYEYVEPPKPLRFLQSIYDPQPSKTKTIGKVMYYYDRPIGVNDNGMASITRAPFPGDLKVYDTVMSLKPVVDPVVDPCRGTADFRLHKMEPGYIYCVRLSEGCFYALGDDPNGSDGDEGEQFSAVENIFSDAQPQITTTPGYIVVNNYTAGTNINVYNVDGKLIATIVTPDSGLMYIPVPSKAVYVVQAGNMTAKVIVR